MHTNFVMVGVLLAEKYQDSGDLMQLLGDGGTTSRGKGQSIDLWLAVVHVPALPQKVILASGRISTKCLLLRFFCLVMKFSSLCVLLHFKSWFYT